MIKADSLDGDGKYIKETAHAWKWGETELDMDVGLSSVRLKHLLEIENARYEKYAPWDREYWKLQYRDPIAALKILFRSFRM